MKEGFLRVAACVPAVNVADVEANVKGIVEMWSQLDAEGVEVAVMPEMCVTGYTCADLFHNAVLINAAREALDRLADESLLHECALIVGLPMVGADGCMYNCAAVLSSGTVAFAAKRYLPNYNEFYERRWWQPMPKGRATTVMCRGEEYELRSGALFKVARTTIGVEICEDLWVPVSPSCDMTMDGGTVIFNLSASDDIVGKYDYLRSLVIGQSGRCMCGYVYASAGRGESSTDLVFDGKALIAENGTLLAEKPRWDGKAGYVVADIDIYALERDRLHMLGGHGLMHKQQATELNGTIYIGEPPVEGHLRRSVNPRPFVPADDAAINRRATEIINIQAAGLCRRLEAIRCKDLVVGISGGLDSTLALLVAVEAFDRLGLDRKGIHGITMPGFGTTDRTHTNALKLMEILGVSTREISIVAAVEQHFKDIGHDPTNHDVTYENSQARERTQLLMDIANQVNGIVLGTGDLSELALGWATYNGDHMSMYGVNAGVPKTLVRYLVRWFTERPEYASVREVLLDIIATPISPELIPAAADGTIKQRTEDLVGPYELHDFFLYYMLRYGFTPRRVYTLAKAAFEGSEYTPEVILKWMKVFYRRFFAQQFKRSCMPDGPKVGSVCLSPRGDWRMPSDASAALWLREVEEL